MNGHSAQTIIGYVKRIDVSAIGINSGEITITLTDQDGQVFVGILPDSPPSHFDPGSGVQNGVFSAYLTLAAAALSSGRLLHCSYILFEKNRINGLSLFA